MKYQTINILAFLACAAFLFHINQNSGAWGCLIAAFLSIPVTWKERKE